MIRNDVYQTNYNAGVPTSSLPELEDALSDLLSVILEIDSLNSDISNAVARLSYNPNPPDPECDQKAPSPVAPPALERLRGCVVKLQGVRSKSQNIKDGLNKIV